MEHWFDRATKFVAGASVARRDVLRNATIAGLAALLPDLSWGQRLPGENPQSPRSSPPQTRPNNAPQPQRKAFSRVLGACHFQVDGPTTVLSYGAETMAGGVPVNLRMQTKTQGLRLGSSNTPAINTSHFLEITSGTQLIFRMDGTFGPSPLRGTRATEGTTSFSYGPSVKGLQSAELSVRNGTVSGRVGQREIVPVPAGSNLNQGAVRFADGQPPPSANLPPALEAAVRQVFAKAQTELRECGKRTGSLRDDAPEQNVVQVGRSIAPAGLASVDAVDPGRNTLWGGGESDDCVACGGSCTETASTCIIAAGVTGFFCPPCAVVAVEACSSAAASCWAGCFVPVIGGCCRTACAPFDCCDKGQQCCGSDGCCDQGEVCNSQNSTCCPSTQPVPCGDGCCPPQSTCCGKNCCPQGTVCLDPARGVCCTPGLGCGQNCCAKGEFCVDAAHGLCCPHPNMINCNGVCCSSASRCINRGTICCDGGIICGNECCTSGLETCSPQLHCGVGRPCGNTFCNLANPVCCNGECCRPNELCVGGKCQTKGCPPGQVPCPVTPGQCCPPKFACCAGNLCCDSSKTECCGPRGCVPKGTCIQ